MNFEYKPLVGWPETLPVVPKFADSLPSSSLPKISVVCPSYQQGRFIEDLIRSVIYQRYPSVEFIVIDGGSKDQTLEVLGQYRDAIAYCVSEPDNGQSDALNKGFGLATGDVVGWQNADDFYLPNAFWEVARRASSLECFRNAVLFGHVHVIEDGQVAGVKYFTRFSQDALVYRGINFATQSLFLGREICHEFRIDESLHFAMDGEFVLRMSRAGVPFYLVNQSLGAYRRHEDAKTIAYSEKSRREWMQVLQDNGYHLKSYRVRRMWLLVKRIFGLLVGGNLVSALVQRPGRGDSAGAA